MKKTLLSATLAGALAASGGAMAAGVIAIDPTGSMGPAGFQVDDIGMSAGYSLMKDLIPGGSDGTFYSQAHVRLLGNPAFPNAMLTYQFGINTESADIGGTLQIGDAGVAGDFSLFFDPDSTDGTVGIDQLDSDSGDGIGYGDMNGSTAALGQVKLLDATITMQAAVFLTPNLGDLAFRYWLSQNQQSDTDPQQVATINWAGTGNFVIDVTTQNRDYVVNEMVGASASLEDIKLLGQGNSAPAQTNDRPTNIVGVPIVASDYGDVVVGVSVSDDFPNGVVSHVVDVPVNDQTCNGAGFGVTCIATFQTSGTLDFDGPSVAEPSMLGLVGLGLAMTGFVGARRRRSRLA